MPDKADVPAFSFRMATLHEQSGVTGPLKQFRATLKEIAARQPLPEYGIRDRPRRPPRARDPLPRPEQARPAAARPRGKVLALKAGSTRPPPGARRAAAPLRDRGRKDR